MNKDNLIILVGNRKYSLPVEKEDDLKDWLKENAKIVIEPSDDLVIDIEETAGASIETGKEGVIKKNEARHKKSGK